MDSRLPARFRPSLTDLALAVLLAVGAQAEVLLEDISGPPEAKIAAASLTTVPLAWRSVAPVVTVACTSGGWALAIVLGLPEDGPLLPLLAPFVAVYSAGVQSTIHGMIAASAVFLVATAIGYSVNPDSVNFGMQLAGLIAALAVGLAVRVMGFESETLQARATQLERERDETARIAVAEERARIARELHDVIGHSISVMGVQAGAVRRLLLPQQEREREALLAVEKTGRDAVDEMRRLLALLREEGRVEEPGPLPTVRRVEDLVEDMRRAGLSVELCVEGNLDDLSPGRSLAAYRILQEALTNVLKHAPGAHVQASLLRGPDELQIRVLDDGNGRKPFQQGGGFGLMGMKERVAMYGGTLEASPGEAGGFSVVARLPVASD